MSAVAIARVARVGLGAVLTVGLLAPGMLGVTQGSPHAAGRGVVHADGLPETPSVGLPGLAIPIYDPVVLAALSAESVAWEVQTTPTGDTLRGIDFVDEVHGWAVGGEADEDCRIMRTDDGGQNWEHVDCPVAQRPEDVDFVDEDTGWLIGREGLIMRSDDGGRTWGRQASPSNSSLTAIFMLDRDRGWITNRDGRVYRTLDGGARWRNENGKKDVGLFDVVFADSMNGWAVGSAGAIIRSTDGGDSWFDVPSGTDGRLYTVDFVDGARGWAAGNDIRHSADGGGSWNRQVTPSKSIEELQFGDDTHGWAVGDEGLIYYTADSGVHWNREAEGLTGRGFRALATFGYRHMWAVASGGLIVHRFDPDAPVPAGFASPTATVPPATATPLPTNTPTITPTPTPTLTPTPTGPWVRIAWVGPGSDILVGAPGAHARRITAVFGNMPATSTITGTISGAATFAGGETTFSSTLFPVNGKGEFPIVIQAVADALPGASFTVAAEVGGATAERPGRVAWQAVFPWMHTGE